MLTKGFASHQDRGVHWQKHHVEFEPPPLSIQGYETLADAFLGGPKTSGVLECTRQKDGRTCRYDTSTEEYGVIASDGHIITYFIADTTRHQYPTNSAYFHANC